MSGVTRQTIPFGTVKRGRVEKVERRGQVEGIVVIADGEEKSPYLLLARRGFYGDVQAGRRGTITFRAGGPMGGYWHLELEDLAK